MPFAGFSTPALTSFLLTRLLPSQSKSYPVDPVGSPPDLSPQIPELPSVTSTFPMLLPGETPPARLLIPGPDFSPRRGASSSPATYRLKIREDFGAAASRCSDQTRWPSAPPRLSGNGSGRASPREPGGSDGGGGAGPTAAQRGRGGRRAVLWAPGLERGRSPAGAEPLNPRRALPGRAGCDGKARRF